MNTVCSDEQVKHQCRSDERANALNHWHLNSQERTDTSVIPVQVVHGLFAEDCAGIQVQNAGQPRLACEGAIDTPTREGCPKNSRIHEIHVQK